MKAGIRKLGRIFPWVGTAALVSYILATTDIKAFEQAISLADIPSFLGLYLLFFLAHILLDSWGIRMLLDRTGIGMPLQRIIPVRAVSYMLGFINYNLGLVLLATAAGRKRKVSWQTLASPFLALNAMDLFVMGCILMYGVLCGAGTRLLPTTDVLMTVAAIGAMSILPAIILLARLGRPWPGFLQGLADTFKALDLRGILLILAARFIFLLTGATADLLMLRTFNLDVPVGVFAQFYPVDAVASVLPVSVAGIGPGLVLMRLFFEPFASGDTTPLASVDAFSISLTTTMVLVRTCFGLVALPFVIKIWNKSGKR